MALALLHALSAAQLPPAAPAISFGGCFKDDVEERNIQGWETAVARGPMVTKDCSAACAGYPFFAMQDSLCQCTRRVGGAARYRPTANASTASTATCGPVCSGEEGLTPPRFCGSGLKGHRVNAVYSRERCPQYDATFVFQGSTPGVGELVTGRSGGGGMREWRAAVVFKQWQVGAAVTLDWGEIPVEVYSIWNAAVISDARGPAVTFQLNVGSKYTGMEVGMKIRGSLGFAGAVDLVKPNLVCSGRAPSQRFGRE